MVGLRLVPGAPSMNLMHVLPHYTSIFIGHIEVLDRALLESQTGGFYQARGETPHPVWLTA